MISWFVKLERCSTFCLEVVLLPNTEKFDPYVEHCSSQGNKHFSSLSIHTSHASSLAVYCQLMLSVS